VELVWPCTEPSEALRRRYEQRGDADKHPSVHEDDHADDDNDGYNDSHSVHTCAATTKVSGGVEQ